MGWVGGVGVGGSCFMLCEAPYFWFDCYIVRNLSMGAAAIFSQTLNNILSVYETGDKVQG